MAAYNDLGNCCSLEAGDNLVRKGMAGVDFELVIGAKMAVEETTKYTMEWRGKGYVCYCLKSCI